MKQCCICKKIFKGWGNNPAPLKAEGECCDACNEIKVIPARIKCLKNLKKFYATSPKQNNGL